MVIPYQLNNTNGDISECKIIEEQKASFVAAFVHDLKNPVIAQIRSIEVMLKGAFGPLTPKQSEVFETILASAKYMNNLLSSVLSVYQYDNGIVQLNYESVNLHKLIEECITEVRVLAEDKNLRFSISSTLSNPVECDGIQIKRVIMNLLSNQIKFAYKNSEIQIRLEEHPDEVSLIFENSSPYISEDKLKNIFERYVSYSTNHNVAGCGIGLYASKRIVEAHNGKIFAKSSKTSRNLFGFHLPKHVLHKDTNLTF